MSSKLTSVVPNSHVPDEEEYPLLYHYGIPVQCKHVRDKLVQEVLKFHGGNAVKYMQANNKRGLVLKIPSSSSRYQFNRNMSCKGNFIDEILEFVATSGHDGKDAPNTAAEWLSMPCSKSLKNNLH